MPARKKDNSKIPKSSFPFNKVYFELFFYETIRSIKIFFIIAV